MLNQLGQTVFRFFMLSSSSKSTALIDSRTLRSKHISSNSGTPTSTLNISTAVKISSADNIDTIISLGKSNTPITEVDDEVDNDDEVVNDEFDDNEVEGAISVEGTSPGYMNPIFDVATIFLKLDLPTNGRASDELFPIQIMFIRLYYVC